MSAFRLLEMGHRVNWRLRSERYTAEDCVFLLLRVVLTPCLRVGEPSMPRLVNWKNKILLGAVYSSVAITAKPITAALR